MSYIIFLANKELLPSEAWLAATQMPLKMGLSLCGPPSLVPTLSYFRNPWESNSNRKHRGGEIEYLLTLGLVDFYLSNKVAQRLGSPAPWIVEGSHQLPLTTACPYLFGRLIIRAPSPGMLPITMFTLLEVPTKNTCYTKENQAIPSNAPRALNVMF